MERLDSDLSIKTEVDFKEELAGVLDTPLSPENINTYAMDALDGLVDLVTDVTDTYSYLPTISFENAQDTERAAFAFFKLKDIDVILDHISEKAEEIRQLDDFIARIPVANRVITPPDANDAINIAGSNGSYAEKATIPRLKTLLFVLSNEFDINLNDPEQLTLQSGVVDPNMVRKQSYIAVSAKNIDRTVLVCDEEDNATFVFDSKQLAGKGIEHSALLELTKSELAELIRLHPEVGQRIVYSEAFVSDIVEAIKEPQTVRDILVKKGKSSAGSSYLYPNAPEDVKSNSGLAAEFGINHNTILKVTTELQEAGVLKASKYRFGVRSVIGYNTQEQEVIRAELERRGLLTEQAPEGVLSVQGLADSLGVSNVTVRKVASLLGEEGVLEEVGRYRFGSTVTNGYTPSQQQVIRERLEIGGVFAPKTPDSVLSAQGIADELGIDRTTVCRAVQSLTEAGILGTVQYYKHGSAIAAGFNQDQQQLIRNALEAKGTLAPRAPEDFLSASGLANELGIDKKTVTSAVARLLESGDLSAVQTYRFGANITPGFNQDQQRIIREELTNRGIFVLPAPDNVQSIVGIAKSIGVSAPTIRQIVIELVESGRLERGMRYRFGASLAPGFDTDQQQLIRNALEAKGTLVPEAPEDVLSASGLANELGIGGASLHAIIKKLKASGALQQSPSYLFRSNIAPGFNKDQQQLIRNALEAKGTLTPRAPEGILSIRGLARVLSVGEKKVKAVVEELDEAGSLGDRGVYKFGANIAPGFDTEQQQRIKDRIRSTQI